MATVPFYSGMMSSCGHRSATNFKSALRRVSEWCGILTMWEQERDVNIQAHVQTIVYRYMYNYVQDMGLKHNWVPQAQALSSALILPLAKISAYVSKIKSIKH